MIFPKSKGVLVVLVWSIAMFVYKPFIITHNSTTVTHLNYAIIGYLALPAYLFLGFIADVFIGRYKIIIVSMHCACIGWTFLCISFYTTHDKYSQPLFGIAGLVLGTVGAAGLQIITIPFNIDQLSFVGASADELSVVIYWHGLAYPLGNLLSRLSHCIITNERNRQAVGICVSGAAISIVMATYYLLRHHLDTTPLLGNPVKLIAKVLNYARKNKYPRQRSALTYWEESAPSRLDLGKDKYGGPFTEEEVEDVKTVLRFCPLLCMFAFIGATVLRPHIHHHHTINLLEKCTYERASDICVVVALMVVQIYKMCCSRLFHFHFPTMLQKIGAGLLVVCIASLLLVAVDVVNYSNNDVKCTLTGIVYKPLLNNYLLALLSWILVDCGTITVLVISMELTIAQSPASMRGLMVGLWFGTIFISSLLNYAIYVPFTRLHSHCSLYYHVTLVLCVLLTITTYCILARRYHLRVRNQVYNIQHVVATTYNRYIQQSYEYRQLGPEF